MKHCWRMLLLASPWVLLLWIGVASAIPVGAPLEFDTPEQANTYQEVIRELRCTVCQNQSLVDSNAGLARDLRRNTYEMVTQGKQQDEIINFMVERYGDFVLYRPPLRWYTAMLWFGPFLLLLAGITTLIYITRRRQVLASANAEDLTDEERKRLKGLLSGRDRITRGEK